MTQAPATPELVERLRSRPHAKSPTLAGAYMLQAAAALEAQQARIAELEVENERLRLTMLGGEDVAGFASSLPLAQVLDSFRTYETALRDSANSAQALADRYEKALRAIEMMWVKGAVDTPRSAVDRCRELARQALSSSQGRHEGGEG